MLLLTGRVMYILMYTCFCLWCFIKELLLKALFDILKPYHIFLEMRLDNRTQVWVIYRFEMEWTGTVPSSTAVYRHRFFLGGGGGSQRRPVGPFRRKKFLRLYLHTWKKTCSHVCMRTAMQASEGPQQRKLRYVMGDMSSWWYKTQKPVLGSVWPVARDQKVTHAI